jgi:hypothetical protein
MRGFGRSDQEAGGAGAGAAGRGPKPRSRAALAARVAAASLLWIAAGCSLFVSDDFTKEGGPAGASGAGGAAGDGGAAGKGAGGGSEKCSGPAPPTVACEPACNFGICDLAGQTCQLQCAFQLCVDQEVPCPEGLNCLIECSAELGCEGATMSCPPGHACVLRCTGKNSCKGVRVRGDGGTLQIDCAGEDACNNMAVECGRKDCSVLLPSPGAPAPRIDRCPPEPCACPQGG